MKSLFTKIGKFVFLALLFLVPIFFVFKNLFFGNHLVGGDAPFFYNDGLNNLLKEPLTWTERGSNFGGVNLILWISPLMWLYGFLGSILRLGNGFAIRIIFFVPSVVLTILGPYLLTKYLRFSRTVSFFASLFYLFNTYFILLIDGGQVGVALAYAIFPISLLGLQKLIDNPNKKSFFSGLSFLFLCGLADPRIAIICVITIIIWNIKNIRNLLPLIPLLMAWIGLYAYWILPLVKISSLGNTSSTLNVNFVSLLHSLFLFQPHWPGNEFGKISYPSFYFSLLPILIFSNRNTRLIFSFLVLAVFATGLNGIVDHLPFGFAFRDASKFFMPLMLFGGILIGSTIESISNKIKNPLFLILSYIFILFLIWPALSGKMNLLLSRKDLDLDDQKIANMLENQGGEFRTVWFTQRSPMSYESYGKPALDGRNLAGFRPIASVNASEDVFNFLNNPKFIDWFKVLGIKYIFLNGDPRNITPNETDVKNWNTITSLFEKTPGIFKLNWGLSYPAYEVPNPLSKFYFVDKLIAVVGDDLTDTTPTVYFEDGKWDPNILMDKDPDSIRIFFNGGETNDLVMSFLQKHFRSSSQNRNSQWAVYGTGDYLKYKYELLIRNFKFKDFDYGKGLAFSTKQGEKIGFIFDVPKDGDYVVAVRSAEKDNKHLKWNFENRNLKKGKFTYEIVNQSDLKILNTIALISKEDFENAQRKSNELIDRFGIIKSEELNNFHLTNLNYQTVETLKYKIDVVGSGWVVFTQNYNSLWGDSLPVYSMVNGFYSRGIQPDFLISFDGQIYFRWGVVISLFSVIVLAIIYFVYERKD